jgi:integrase
MRQRGDAWQLRVYAGLDPVTGEKRWLSQTVKGGKRAAQRVLAGMVAQVDRGTAVTDATFGQLLEKWFEVRAPDWSPRTVVEHRSVIERHIRPRIGAVKLRRLQAADLDSFYAQMRKLPGRRSKYVSPATIRRVNVVIRSSLGQAVKWGWLPSNPAAAASPPKVVAPTVLAPPADGVARLLADVETEEPEFHAYLRLAVSTGARRSQMCALQWRDADLAGGAVTFARGVVEATRQRRRLPPTPRRRGTRQPIVDGAREDTQGRLQSLRDRHLTLINRLFG